MRLRENKGVTLVEMIMSTAIFTIIMAGMYGMLHVGNTSWAIQEASVSGQTQARRAMGWLSRDLRVASSLTITQEDDDVDISFTRGANNYTYAWTPDAGEATRYQLIRTNVTDDESLIVARNITALSFTEAATDIKINMTLTTQSKQSESVDYNLVGNIARR